MSAAPDCICGGPQAAHGALGKCQHCDDCTQYRPIAPACRHENMRAEVGVHPIVADGADLATARPSIYYAQIVISCGDCGVPFEFIGVQPGWMPTGPMCSIDFTQLNAPIKPKGENLVGETFGFTVTATVDRGASA